MTRTFNQIGTRLVKPLLDWLQARFAHKLEKYVVSHHLADH